MTKRAPTSLLLVCAALCLACESDRGLEPEPSTLPEPPSLPEPPAEPEQSVLTILDLRPAVADLLTVAPGNAIQLSISAWDQRGAELSGVGAATYSSSAPAVADVSPRGEVTAAAPGSAVITATLTLGGVTRRASMTARVHDDPQRYPEMAGVYDLTGLITGSDPVWGIEDGTRQTAVLTIDPSRGSPRFSGSFPEFCAIDSGGPSCNPHRGFVSGTVNSNDEVVIELTFAGSGSSYLYGEGRLESDRIVGRYGAGGHISGTFTAQRR